MPEHKLGTREEWEVAGHDAPVAYGAGEVGGEGELAGRELVGFGEAGQEVILGEAELAVAVVPRPRSRR
jgi:hypothetical protein